MFLNKKDVIDLFHQEYEKSCAKKDINALKNNLSDLAKKITDLNQPKKKVTKKEKQISDLVEQIQKLEINLSYVDKNGSTRYNETNELIELKYKLLQLNKNKDLKCQK